MNIPESSDPALASSKFAEKIPRVKEIPVKFGERKFRPGALWLDDKGVPINAHGGGMLQHGGKVYWFGEHKIEGTAGNHAHVGVHVYSSEDLYSWRDEGIALSVSEDPASEIHKDCVLERPKVVFCKSTGKFVMWFHLESDEKYCGAKTGIAVADSPTGPYRYLQAVNPNKGQWPLNVTPDQQNPENIAKAQAISVNNGQNPFSPTLNLLGRDFERGQDSRDMTLFLDDDGTAYHIHSAESNSTLHFAALSEDFLSFDGAYARAFPSRWMEAPAVLKRKNLYYLIASGCTGWAPNPARSAVAESVFGPWQELGNPAEGPGAERTFEAQSTYILPVPGKEDAFIFMADIWRPENAIDGRYVWLPIVFKDGKPTISWLEEWDLSVFDQDAATPTA